MQNSSPVVVEEGPKGQLKREGLRRQGGAESGQARPSGFSENPDIFTSPFFLAYTGISLSQTRRFLCQIFIYSALHSFIGLGSVPGLVLNPGDTEWGGTWSLHEDR